MKFRNTLLILGIASLFLIALVGIKIGFGSIAVVKEPINAGVGFLGQQLDKVFPLGKSPLVKNVTQPVAVDLPVANENQATVLDQDVVPQGFSPECTFLNWMAKADQYKVDGGYLIPLADLRQLAGASWPGIIYFEGDDYGVIEHHVAVVDGGTRTSQGVFINDSFKFIDGAFWACSSSGEKLVLQDEIVATSLWKKWKNLFDQGETMRVCVYQTTGITCFEPGQEPNLLDTAVLEAGYHDCDDNTAIAEQTPYGFQKNGDILTAHAGASNCRTLYVGQIASGGGAVAIYFTGARNGFTYVDGGRFFLIPTTFGSSDIQSFVDAAFPGQGLTIQLMQ